MLFGYLPLLFLLIVGAVYFHNHPDAASRARFLRRTGFGFMALVTVIFAVFVIGETVSDPGGLAAAGWIAAWLIPLVGLILLARYLPSVALRVFVALTLAVLAVTVWAVAASDSWRSFEDDHGPVRTIMVFVVSAALGVYGLRRPREAGWLLVTLGVLPLALSSLARNLALGSLAAAVTPALIAGPLYLIAAYLDPGTARAPPSRPKDRLGVG
ncbi:MAG TPA: hypothetical protein VE441_00430 [Mycobacterium sp.]|jgi:hypothetical membrane protein|nr:hypothetical protein [Mycobacterium sp.]